MYSTITSITSLLAEVMIEKMLSYLDLHLKAKAGLKQSNKIRDEKNIISFYFSYNQQQRL